MQMFDAWNDNPIIRFFGEITLMVLAAAVLVWIFGLTKDWSRPVDYSNGFFLACVALAAVSSSRAILKRPGIKKDGDKEPLQLEQKPVYENKAKRFFATRSFNFKMLMSSLICLIISILIAQ